jgi:DNA-binding transcriptional LysR family regulator
VAAEELAGEPWILMSHEDATRSAVEHALRSRGIEPFVRFETDDLNTMIGLAAQGLGVGIAEQRHVRLHADKVATLKLEGAGVRLLPALAWPERGPHMKALEHYLGFVESWLESSVRVGLA